MQRRLLLAHLLGAGAMGLGAALRPAPALARTRARPDPAAAAALRTAHNTALLAGLAAPGPPLRRWQWLVVHHTAAEFATLEGIDRYHRTRFGDPLGAEYHFVINNGRKDGARRPVGMIEVARWRHQQPAWHLFKPDNAPASLAICLVGNFETRPLPPEMLAALTELSRALMQLCAIPLAQVSTHRVVDEKLTQCPGQHFPREAFLRGLADPA